MSFSTVNFYEIPGRDARAHTHTHMHTYAHIRTQYTCTHTTTHIYVYPLYIRKYMCAHTFTRTRSHVHTHTHHKIPGRERRKGGTTTAFRVLPFHLHLSIFLPLRLPLPLHLSLFLLPRFLLFLLFLRLDRVVCVCWLPVMCMFVCVYVSVIQPPRLPCPHSSLFHPPPWFFPPSPPACLSLTLGICASFWALICEAIICSAF